MANLKNQFGNLKSHQLESSRQIIQVDKRDYAREAHGIQDGIKKDKKVKINRKFS